MARHYRILEGQNGLFYPQTKKGWFSWSLNSWVFFYADADQLTHPTRIDFVVTNDPENSARFTDEGLANKFIKRFVDALDDGCRKESEAYMRRLYGVQAKRSMRYKV
jgi:hypothetical protein